MPRKENQAQRTREELASAYESCLEHMPDEKISVAQIARKCGISRQMFYHYFHDKRELVCWTHQHYVEGALYSKERTGTFFWKQSVLQLLQLITRHRTFYEQLAKHDYSDMFYSVLYESTRAMYERIIVYRTGRPLSDSLSFLLSLYCIGGIHLLVDWAGSPHNMTVEEIADLFYRGMPAEIQAVLTDKPVPLSAVLP